MSTIILSTGHAFAQGSVMSISPAKVCFYSLTNAIYDEFEVIGIGFSVKIDVNSRTCPDDLPPLPDPKTELIRQEFISKLLA